MKALFLIDRIDSLEKRTIFEMVSKRYRSLNAEYQVKELFTQHSETGETASRVEGYLKNYNPVYLIGHALDDVLSDELDKLVRLDPENTIGGLPVILQVAAITSNRVGEYARLVGILSKGRAISLRKADVPLDSIHELTLSDRLLRGGTMHDERLAAELAGRGGVSKNGDLKPVAHIQMNKTNSNGASMRVHLFRHDGVLSESVRLALLDNYFAESSTETVIIVNGDENGVRTALVWSTNPLIEALKTTFTQNYSYSCQVDKETSDYPDTVRLVLSHQGSYKRISEADLLGLCANPLL